jgi:hypothetical protein
MSRRKHYINTLILLLLLGVFLSMTIGCGKESDNIPTSPEDKEQPSEQAQQDGTPTYYEFVPKFEDQVIYDKDGITMTVMVEDNAEYLMSTYADPLLRLKVNNQTDRKITVSALNILLEDGFTMPLFNQVYPIEPKEEDEYKIFFMADLCSRPRCGSYTLFQDLGMGKKLGDFGIQVRILDTETYDHVDEFESAIIKTENSGTFPDYTNVHAKSLLIDQDGIKLYHLDNLYLPMDQEYYETDDVYLVIMLLENETDQNISLNYSDESWNGEQVLSIYLDSRDVDAHGKQLIYFYVGKDKFVEAGLDPPTNLTFITEIRGDNFDLISQTEKISIDFPQPWPYAWELQTD